MVESKNKEVLKTVRRFTDEVLSQGVKMRRLKTATFWKEYYDTKTVYSVAEMHEASCAGYTIADNVAEIAINILWRMASAGEETNSDE